MGTLVSQTTDMYAASSKVVGRYWRKILANMPDAVLVYDLDGRVVYANNQASNNLRYASAEQLMNQTVTDFAERYMFIDENGSLLGIDSLPSRRALRDNMEVDCVIHFVETQGEEDFWLSIKAFPITGRGRTPKFVVICYHDLTSLKLAETLLKDSNRRIAGILDDLLKLD